MRRNLTYPLEMKMAISLFLRKEFRRAFLYLVFSETCQSLFWVFLPAFCVLAFFAEAPRRAGWNFTEARQPLLPLVTGKSRFTPNSTRM